MIPRNDYHLAAVSCQKSCGQLIQKVCGHAVLIAHDVLPIGRADRDTLNQITTHHNSAGSWNRRGLAQVPVTIGK